MTTLMWSSGCEDMSVLIGIWAAWVAAMWAVFWRATWPVGF